MEVCGYEDGAIKKELDKMETKDRIARCVKSIREGFMSLGSNNAIYPNIYEYADMVYTIYGEEEIGIAVEQPIELATNERGSAENAVFVKLSWGTSKFSAIMDVLVFYCETKGGSVIINDVAFDQATLAKYGSTVCSLLVEADKFTGNLEAVAVKYFKKNKPLTAEEKLLKTIFGENPGRTTVKTVEGIGFTIDEELEYVFKNFLKKHKDTFCSNSNDERIFSEYVEGDVDRKDAFLGYGPDMDTSSISSSWGDAVVNIIYRETGLNVSFFGDYNAHYSDEELEQYDVSSTPIILFTFRAPWELNEVEKQVSKEFVIKTLDTYARELRGTVGEYTKKVLIKE